MIGRRFGFIAFILAGFISAGDMALAQTEPAPMVLNLRNALDSQKERPTNFGEYRISLDSQIMDNASTADAGESRFTDPVPEGDFVLRTKLPESIEFFNRDLSPRLPGAPLRRSEAQEIGSTLTLTATYFADKFGRVSDSPETMGVQRRLGRWAIYGEIGSKATPRNRAPAKGRESSPLIKPMAMMNVTSAAEPKNPTGEPTISKIPSPEENEVPTMQNYYLEATYNFRPSLKGKVSYKKSQVDPAEQNEDLQVEGIVETGKDTMIKAGYRNQSTQESHETKKPANDKKVWTEFILKF